MSRVTLIPPEKEGLPWRLPFWNGRVTVAFSYAKSGWIQMALMATPFCKSVVVHCSDVFDPFPAMQMWLEKIARKELPADWEIDEEETMVLLRARAEPDGCVDFQVWSNLYADDEENKRDNVSDLKHVDLSSVREASTNGAMK